jgi:hypothetical protein
MLAVFFFLCNKKIPSADKGRRKLPAERENGPGTEVQRKPGGISEGLSGKQGCTD